MLWPNTSWNCADTFSIVFKALFIQIPSYFIKSMELHESRKKKRMLASFTLNGIFPSPPLLFVYEHLTPQICCANKNTEVEVWLSGQAPYLACKGPWISP